MARLSLTCSCGWKLFVPDTTPGHEVSCPSCQNGIPIPGRVAGGPTTAGEIARERQRKQSLVKMAVGGSVVAALAIAGGIAYLTTSRPSLEDAAAEQARAERFSQPAPRPQPKAAAPAPLPPIPADTPLFTQAQIQDMRHSVHAHVWLINMSTVISEIFRLRNLTPEWAQTQAEIGVYDGRIKMTLAELAKVGDKVHLEPYLAMGDQIVGFAQRDFTTMKNAEAAKVLHTWVNNWRHGTHLEQVLILRGGVKMTLYMEFPEDTKELLNLVRHSALQADGSPDLPTLAEVVGVPADVLQAVESGFKNLPPGYKPYLGADDLKRLELILSSKKGTPEDTEWLKSRILGEALPAFQKDADQVRSQMQAIAPKLKETASVDVIHRKNDKLEGQIVEETDLHVKIKVRLGGITIPRGDIVKIEKGKGSATEFPGRYAEAKASVDKLMPLLAWCAEKNLKLEKEYVACTVLTLDASNDNARKAAGLPKPLDKSPAKPR